MLRYGVASLAGEWQPDRDWHLSQRELRGGHGFPSAMGPKRGCRGTHLARFCNIDWIDAAANGRPFSFRNQWAANSAEIARERELHRLAATDVGRRRVEKRRRHPEASLPLLNVQT